VITKADFCYYDLGNNLRCSDISLLFPNWKDGDERVAIFCPHDDDGILGAGYSLLAAKANSAEVYIFIFCDGRAGYSTPEEKATIVLRRIKESTAAYESLGINRDDIIRFNYADFSVPPYIGWYLPSGGEGTFSKTIPIMRKLRITRLVIPNGYREHIDHEGVFRIAAYDGPQIGDKILAEWGDADPLRSMIQYAVWGDLSPEDALVTGRDTSLRANKVIKANFNVEQAIAEALNKFESQQKVIEMLLKARVERKHRDGMIEVYLAFDPRPSLDYTPYHRAIGVIDKQER